MSIVKRQIDDVVVDLGSTRALIHVCSMLPDDPIATIFFIPGFSGLHTDFDQTATYLASCGYATVQFDMLGRGQSSKLNSELYSLNTYLLSLYQLANIYKRGRLIIVGDGWGGAIGTAFCLSCKSQIPLLIVTDLKPVWTLDEDIDITYVKHIAANPRSSFSDAINGLVQSHPKLSSDVQFLNRYLQRKISPDNIFLTCDSNCLHGLSSYQKSVFTIYDAMKSLSKVLILGSHDDDWMRVLHSENPRNIFHIGNSSGERRIGFSGQEDLLAILGFLNLFAMLEK